MKSLSIILLTIFIIYGAAAKSSELHECSNDGGEDGNYYSHYNYKGNLLTLYTSANWRRFVSWEKIDRLPESHVDIGGGYLWQGVKRESEHLIEGIFLYSNDTEKDILIKEGIFSQIFINSDEVFVFEERLKSSGSKGRTYDSVLLKINLEDYSLNEVKVFPGEIGVIYAVEDVMSGSVPNLSRNSNLHFITGQNEWAYYYSYKGESDFLPCYTF